MLLQMTAKIRFQRNFLVSLDPSDILGSFFQLLSQSGSSSDPYYSSSVIDRPPFYLDPSTNLLQGVVGGGGSYSFQVIER